MYMPRATTSEEKMRDKYSKFKVRKIRKGFERMNKLFVERRTQFERSHRVVYTFTAGVGLITFWYGIWEGLKMIPVLGHPLVAILLGGAILLLCGAYAYQLLGGQAAALMQGLDNVTEVVEDLDDVADSVEELTDKVEGLAEERRNVTTIDLRID